MEIKWREILEKVERGELSPEEGAARMAQATRQMPADAGEESPARESPVKESLEGNPGPLAAPGAKSSTTEAEVVEDFESVYAFWRSWWVLPLSVGAIIFVLGASLEAWANATQHGFWMVCGVFPLLLGIIVLVLSFWSRTARWLHIRVRAAQGAHGTGGKPATRVAISMPIPAQTIGWMLKLFGRFIPGLRDQPQVYNMIPEMMAALDKSGDPLVVEVNDKNGDEVRVYIM